MFKTKLFTQSVVLPVAMLALLLSPRPSAAHFLWLKTIGEEESRQAFLFFGEDARDEAYHLPERLAAVEIWRHVESGRRQQLETKKLESAERVGLVAPLEGRTPQVVEASRQYGFYGGSLLTYFAKHVATKSNAELQDLKPSEQHQLDIVPGATNGGIELVVFWEGKPLRGVTATIQVGDEEPIEQTTDEEGRVRHTPKEAALVGVLVGHQVDGLEGTIDDKPYTSASNYASLTFRWHGSEEKAAAEPSGGDKAGDDEAADESVGAASAGRGPDLPEPLASFGAAVAEGWLYVYGGHTGAPHDHSQQNLSQHFRRAPLDGDGEWEDLPMETRLQGLPLVAHDGKLYRLGGMNARNATVDDEEDLHSTAEFARFDPATGKWTSLDPLPEGRSSHDAVVVGDRLYVVGGWTLSGPGRGKWLDHSLMYDFAKPASGWQKLPAQPFKRRALAVGAWQGKIVAIGGMDDDSRVSQRVDLFDPAEGKWSVGPDLPGEDMAGFGVSAWNLDGELYVSGLAGKVYRLAAEGAQWRPSAELETPRFFHRLLPGGTRELLAVGGASSGGHLTETERIRVGEEPEEPQGPAAASVPREDDSAGASPGDVWPAFRGLGNSLTNAKNLPLEWSDDENIAWSVALPGYGQSSPIVWRGSVYVTTMQGENKETPTVIRYDLASGDQRWQREFESSQQTPAGNMVTRGAPTPAVDGDRVYALFESGDLLALDHDGNTVWQRSLVADFGPLEGIHGIGSSLATTDSAVIVLVSHAGPSYLMAVAKSSGEPIWKADYEPRVAWSSPIVQRGKGRETVVVSAAGFVEAYDGTTGSRLWGVDSLAGNTVPSATAAGGLLFIGSQEVASNLAIDTGGTEPEIVWRSGQATCNFSSPLVHRGLVYLVNRAGVAFCLDAATGEEVWKERLGDTCWASPIGAGDRVYFFAKGGRTVAVRAGRSFERLAENDLTIDADTRVYGVAAVDGALVLRCGSRLIRVGRG